MDYNLNSLTKKSNKTNPVFLMVLLFLSFAWVNLYTSLNFSGQIEFGGNIFELGTSVSNIAFSTLLVNTALGWISFELFCYFYRFILSFKIYSFVVPHDVISSECRKFFIYRNLVYGLFTNCCFIFPYMFIFNSLASLVITMSVMICFALSLTKRYAEKIIGHFVFKCFCFPIMLYEGIVIIFDIWRAIA